ncbi:GNAT family N-acetyltransferase [Anaerobacillus isosaccharinicus]|uniref:GNAT family N-acetyltransferase n=1 Tax=Anaerobacillus isosaccharinicus TaxID=1532552 RepID=A0A1S2KV48_9BACI|nr:GNAT family protein [Anaerobacillus isosaccharinicus]MBA5588010.1 GNAT family N-acetyltransferase [Anaerobacillus isosaccharinicus]QOY33844.1 GNAT family N-acetyltransferase [Anaerobacillus isosaccharinicus]
MFPILETDRFILREITETDTAGIFACFSNEEVTKYYGQETLKNKEEAKEFVTFFAQSYRDKRGIRWGIELKSTREFIGTIGFNALSLKHKRAEIGYELLPQHWRKGYATEAISKVLEYGFNDLGLTRIGAVVFVENIASSQLLLRLGFEKEGVLKQYMYQNGIAHDTYVYGLLKEQAYE